jgi:hypothetical protein
MILMLYTIAIGVVVIVRLIILSVQLSNAFQVLQSGNLVKRGRRRSCIGAVGSARIDHQVVHNVCHSGRIDMVDIAQRVNRTLHKQNIRGYREKINNIPIDSNQGEHAKLWRPEEPL